MAAGAVAGAVAEVAAVDVVAGVVVIVAAGVALTPSSRTWWASIDAPRRASPSASPSIRRRAARTQRPAADAQKACMSAPSPTVNVRIAWSTTVEVEVTVRRLGTPHRRHRPLRPPFDQPAKMQYQSKIFKYKMCTYKFMSQRIRRASFLLPYKFISQWMSNFFLSHPRGPSHCMTQA